MHFGSTTTPCPLCGKPALCSANKGVWCAHCKNGALRLAGSR